jgi:hypothetical protein
MISVPLKGEAPFMTTPIGPELLVPGAERATVSACVSPAGAILVLAGDGHAMYRSPCSEQKVVYSPNFRRCTLVQFYDEKTIAVMNEENTAGFLTMPVDTPNRGTRYYAIDFDNVVRVKCGLKPRRLPPGTAPAVNALALRRSGDEQAWVYCIMDSNPAGPDRFALAAFKVRAGKAVAVCDLLSAPHNHGEKRRGPLGFTPIGDGDVLYADWALQDQGEWFTGITLDRWSESASVKSRVISLKKLGRVVLPRLIAADHRGNIYIGYEYGIKFFARNRSDDRKSLEIRRGDPMAIAIIRPGSDVAEPLFDLFKHYGTEKGGMCASGHVLGTDDTGALYIAVADDNTYRVDKISFPPQPPKPWWQGW